jgi:hypothetical protein
LVRHRFGPDALWEYAKNHHLSPTTDTTTIPKKLSRIIDEDEEDEETPEVAMSTHELDELRSMKRLTSDRFGRILVRKLPVTSVKHKQE